MFNSQVSLTNLMFNINSNSTSGLVLNKGEIVGGLVQEVKSDGRISLLIQGKLVEALSEVSVEKGQQVYLSVEDFRDGRIYLKLVTPEALTQLGESNLADNLKSIGVAVDQQSLAVAKKLLHFGLPATRENINEAARSLKMLGGYTPQNVEISVLAMAGKLSVNETVLKSLKQYFTSQNDIGKLVENAFQLVDQDMESLSGISQPLPKVNASHNEVQTTQARASLPNTTLPLREEPVQISRVFLQDNMNQELKQTSNIKASSQTPLSKYTQVIPAELEPGGFTAGQVQGENEPPSTTPVIMSDSKETGKKQALDLVKDLLRELVIIDQEDPEINTGKMESRAQKSRSLVKSLGTIQDLLVKLEHNHTTNGRELLGRLSDLEKEIGSQQITNYLAKSYTVLENQPANSFYLSFPVQIDNQYRQVQIKVDRNNRQDNLKEADQLSLVVALDTLNMGRVLFHVDWSRSGQLGIKGVVESQSVGDFVGSHLDLLTRVLSDRGYRVDNRGIIVSQNIDEEINLKPRLEETSEDLRFWRIDITV